MRYSSGWPPAPERVGLSVRCAAVGVILWKAVARRNSLGPNQSIMNLGGRSFAGDAHARLASCRGAHSGRYLFLGLSKRVPGLYGLVRPSDPLMSSIIAVATIKSALSNSANLAPAFTRCSFVGTATEAPC
jgi:hypothetical protein